jgi:Skp family chaperone for outer membrane proteins
MKTTVFFAIATLVPGILLMQANGGNSVAVIDFERAINDAPGGKDAITKINAFRNQQLTAIETKQKEVSALQERLRIQDRTLSDATRAQLTKDLQTAQASMQSIGDEGQKKLAQMQQELLDPVEQKTAMAVSAYASEHSLKIVLDSSAFPNGFVYVHDTADITTEIIRRIASNLENHRDLDASLASDRFLNRKWLKFSIRPEEHRTGE